MRILALKGKTFFRQNWWCRGSWWRGESRDECTLHRAWNGMRTSSSGAMGVCEGRAARDPALSVPACVLRVLDARHPLRTFLRAGRAGRRLSAGPAVEDSRRLGSAAVPPAMVWVFQEGAVEIPDLRPPRHCAVSDSEESQVTGAGSVLLAALCGGLRMLSAFWHALLHMALHHAQSSLALPQHPPAAPPAPHTLCTGSPGRQLGRAAVSAAAGSEQHLGGGLPPSERSPLPPHQQLAGGWGPLWLWPALGSAQTAALSGRSSLPPSPP